MFSISKNEKLISALVDESIEERPVARIAA
jgi:hypothetical protein